MDDIQKGIQDTTVVSEVLATANNNGSQITYYAALAI